MNKIVFQKARFRNFLSYGNQWQEFIFPIGMNMVQGLNVDTQKSNGAGKSSVTELIPFGLFGKTIKNLAQTKVINWANKKTCMVELYFTVNDEEYVFKRGLKPNKFIVTRNGHEIVRPSDIKSFQYQMEEEVIGMDFKTFKNLIYFSPNNTVSILGAKKEVKRQFLESLFDLTDYSEMLKLTNTKCATIAGRVTDAQTEIDNRYQMIEMIKNDISKIVKPDLRLYKLNVSQCDLLIEGYEALTFDEVAIAGLYDLKVQLNGLNASQIKFDADKERYTSEIEITQKALDNIDISKPKEQTEKLDKAISLLNDRIALSDIDVVSDTIVSQKERYQELTDNVEKLKKDVIEASGKHDLLKHIILSEQDNINTINARGKVMGGKDVCDFCGSDCNHSEIVGFHKEQIRTHLERIEKDTKDSEAIHISIIDMNMDIGVANGEIIELTKTLEELKKSIIAADKDIEKRDQCIENKKLIPDVKKMGLYVLELKGKIEDLQQKLRDIMWKVDMNTVDIELKTKAVNDRQIQSDEYDQHIKRLSDAKIRLEEGEKQLIEMTKHSDTIDEQILVKNQTIVDKANDTIELTASIVKFNKMLDHLNYLRVSLKDDNVKQFAISSLLPYLNSRANYYLQESGFPYIVYIDGWLDVIIKGMGTEDVGYDSLSGGEQKAMDMAIQLACNDIAELHAKTTLGVAVYDEIMDTSLDADGVQKLMDVVRVKQRDHDNCVLIISHRDEVKELDFDNYVMIEKENGFSIIQTQSTMV